MFMILTGGVRDLAIEKVGRGAEMVGEVEPGHVSWYAINYLQRRRRRGDAGARLEESPSPLHDGTPAPGSLSG